MKRLNKKGFTLIEMLVVIAIIAILVSIIVPVVGNSTTKAAAATNAANLRSVAAEAAIRHLEDPVAVANGQTYTAVDGVITLASGVTIKAPVSKAVKDVVAGGKPMKVVITQEEVYATYEGLNGTDLKVDDFADVADNGKADGSNGNTNDSEVEKCGCTGYSGRHNLDNDTWGTCSVCGCSAEDHQWRYDSPWDQPCNNN